MGGIGTDAKVADARLPFAPGKWKRPQSLRKRREERKDWRPRGPGVQAHESEAADHSANGDGDTHKARKTDKKKHLVQPVGSSVLRRAKC